MKILGLTSSDISGSAFNLFDAQEHLADSGISLKMVVGRKQSDKDWVEPLLGGRAGQLAIRAVRNGEVLSGKQNHFQFWSSRLFNLPQFKEADVIHLNIVHDHWFKTEEIVRMSREKPVVWTWHDLWPVTGHCIQTYACERWASGCGNCPDLKRPLPVRRDITRSEYSRKQNLLRDFSGHIHVSTKWMSDQIQPHISEAGLRVRQFPFGLFSQGFSAPTKSAARRALGLNMDEFVILTRSTQDPIKRFNDVLAAVNSQKLGGKVTLLTVGEPPDQEWLEAPGIKVVSIGWTDSRERLSTLYSAADLHVQISHGESFGMMAVEAMFHRLPSAVARGTALEEVVGESGFALDPNNVVNALRTLVERLVENRSLLQARQAEAKNLLERRYSPKNYVQDLASLYSEAIAGFGRK